MADNSDLETLVAETNGLLDKEIAASEASLAEAKASETRHLDLRGEREDLDGRSEETLSDLRETSDRLERQLEEAAVAPVVSTATPLRVVASVIEMAGLLRSTRHLVDADLEAHRSCLGAAAGSAA